MNNLFLNASQYVLHEIKGLSLTIEMTQMSMHDKNNWCIEIE